MGNTNENTLKFSRLMFLGFATIGAAILILIVSSFIDWRTPSWGILIRGHRTDVFLCVVGLMLLGSSLIVSGFGGRRRASTIFSGLLLATSVLALGLSPVEWYLRHPSRLYLRVAPQIRRIERRYVEPGVGLRHVPCACIHRAIEPYCNISLTRKDPKLIAEESHEVEIYIDRNGFPNRLIPEKADIVVLGDSFVEVVQVPWDQRWVSILQEMSGLSVYNLGHGGYCPSQEVQLYDRYGDIKGVRLVILCVNGINDMDDERNYSHFLESGLGPREWALKKARRYHPPQTFGFIQAAQRWWKDHHPRSTMDNELEPIMVTNTTPSTVVAYYPPYQLRAWQLVYLEPGENPGVASIKSNIIKLSQLCEAQGRRVVVVYLPLKQTIHPPDPDDQQPWIEFLKRTLPWVVPEGWDDEKIAAAGRLLLEGDRRLEAHLSSVCDSLGISFHSTIPALERYVQTSRSLAYFRFDTHWNTNGNEAVGKDMAAWIEDIWQG